MGLSHDALERLPWEYFEAVDRKDLAGSLAFFAEDATFTVQSARITFSGHDEIAGMFRGFFADFSTIDHRITNIVVDEATSRYATEQFCAHINLDGTSDPLNTCNFYDIGPDGRFTRVRIWLDGENPPVDEG